MVSEIKADKLLNQSGDQDSGIDLSTNDVVAVKTANTERMRIDSTGKVGIGVTPPTDAQVGVYLNGGGATYSTSSTYRYDMVNAYFSDAWKYIGNGVATQIYHANGAITFSTASSNSSGAGASLSWSERCRVDGSGHFLVANTDNSSNSLGVKLRSSGQILQKADGTTCLLVNRGSDDGVIISIRQDDAQDGTISSSVSTVSYNGFCGLHESSGIASDTPVGTVCSTIDELDIYPDTQDGADHPKKGKTRADHAKVKVSDSAGDKRIYGVLQRFDPENGNKPMIASVGIGSVRVTGACAGGDLLESNGDGTAKVQSDDIVKSKTIGKVTIGNSSTDVKLVSCVLYSG